jgi:restriction system protein
MERASAQAARARERLQTQAIREADRIRRREEAARIAGEKERLRLFHEAQEAEVQARNEGLAESINRLDALLADSLKSDHRLDFNQLKPLPDFPTFDPGSVGQPEATPRAEDYLPKPLGFFARLIPGAQKRHQTAVREARARFDIDTTRHAAREQSREYALSAKVAVHEEAIRKIGEQVDRQRHRIDELKIGYEGGNNDAIRQYCEAVLSSEHYPDGWPESFRIAFVPESKQLVVEYDFPGFEIVPQIAIYKYIKAKKEIVTAERSESDRRRIYSSIIAQTALRIVHVLFNADYAAHLESIVFNGHVAAVDQATGQDVHPCLVTLRTTREIFLHLDLSRVDPETCLKGLNASVSKKPIELAPVKPVLEFDMVDPRFVQEEDILSGLDNRTNLMLLSPREFESLITNLFEKMGLETRQTRPSRDGGVDCVAYDPRPIFGGKVVIQAKRYKHTVGVSAVRDLFGTVQNEGASKGILVTTSGFGRASFEFADGKPLELLSGSNLLYLLAQNAGIEAKIEIPDDWKDPSPDSGE